MCFIKRVFVALVLAAQAATASATLIGDEIQADAVWWVGGAGQTTVFNADTAIVGAGVEFSAPNFFGGGSLFEIDITDGMFTVFVDLADLSFLLPTSVILSDLDWSDGSELQSVTQVSAVGQFGESVTGWLDDITVGTSGIGLASDPALFASGVSWLATFTFTTTPGDGGNGGNGGDGGNGGTVTVPEPGTLSLLFAAGLFGFGLLRKRARA